MRYHKLRIASSVVCGLACVLLIVLWVRSFWWVEVIGNESATGVSGITISAGKIKIWGTRGTPIGAIRNGWHHDVIYNPTPIRPFVSVLLPGLEFNERMISIPIWWLVVPSAILTTAVVWLPKRGSNRKS